jgi:hypothetical protein
MSHGSINSSWDVVVPPFSKDSAQGTEWHPQQIHGRCVDPLTAESGDAVTWGCGMGSTKKTDI